MKQVKIKLPLRALTLASYKIKCLQSVMTSASGLSG